MVSVGFHASHEQLAPSALLSAVRRAEEAGFQTAMCSDHLQPWSERQGHSGNAWTWLGAALATTSLPFGVVTAPGQRYHPVITAQAIATIGELFPGRFWEDVRSKVVVSSDLGEITARLQAMVALGVDGLALHHVGQDQDRFIDVFGAKVVPQLVS